MRHILQNKNRIKSFIAKFKIALETIHEKNTMRYGKKITQKYLTYHLVLRNI
jgi:hypothetical protein